MPTAKFKTTVSCPSVPSRKSVEVVIASIVKWLTESDTTGRFSYHGDIQSVEIAPKRDSIVIHWTAPVASTDDIREVAEEFEKLSHVRYHTCVSNPTIA